MEPLCCLQSCLIREGCLTIAIFEGIIIIILFITLFLNYQDNEQKIDIKIFEEISIHELESFKNINKLFFLVFKIFIIILLIYNIVSC